MRRKFYLAFLTSFMMLFPVLSQTVDESTTITWQFDTGTKGQTATYSETTSDYFKPDYVNIGTDLTYEGIETGEESGFIFTKFGTKIKNSNPSDNDYVSFNISPVKGLKFKPTEINFNCERFGTSGGLIDVIWKSSDGTLTSLKTGIKPDRKFDNKYADAVYEVNIDISSLTISESDSLSSLIFHIYSYDPGKTVGIANIKITGNVTGTIINVTNYILNKSVSPENAGDITSDPFGNEFEVGTEVTLTANKSFGYEFSHWADGSDQEVSTDNPFTFTLSSDTNLKAVFNALNTYSLTANTDGGANDYMLTYSPEGTMVDGARMYEEGTNVTITAKGNPILTFTNWGNGETSTDLTVSMTEDKEVTAYYSAIDYIVGWDFYLPGNQGRVADFYSTDDNQTAALILRDADGNVTSWLDKSTVAAGGYEAAEGAAVNWNNISDKYYYQISFNASDYKNIIVSADMLYNFNAYSVQRCEYSLDGTNFTLLGTFTMNAEKTLFYRELTLPNIADNAEMVYIRWIPDYSSSIVGTSVPNDGTCISSIYVTGTEEIVDDGTAPVLINSIPANNATGASATGKIVLTFDEKVKVAEGAVATLGEKELEPQVSGKTITFPYAGLEYNTEYTFSLPANSVTDLTNNALADAIDITFTTLNRPTVTKKGYDFIVGVDGDFADALEAAEGASSSGNRFYIFFPDGEYDLGTKTGDGTQQTHIGIPNVSYIGESADGVILYNNPDPSDEGIGTTPTINLLNNSDNTYMQDLSILNKMDYRIGTFYGRAVALRDQGDRNIFKNVKLLSNQDTYYTGPGRSYWENSEIHGTVDFIFGDGDLFFNDCLIYLEDRSGNHVTAAATSSEWGYVFSNCTIDGFSSTNGNYKLGRPWNNAPKVVYLNTTMNVIPAADGWGDPMNVVPNVFAEYNSMTESGSTVDLSNRRTTYSKDATTVELDPVLEPSEAAAYTLENVMGGDDSWQPNLYTEQAPVPVISLDETTISWNNSDYVLGWAIIMNGAFIDFITTNSYTIPDSIESGVFTVRAANEMGGLSTASNQALFNTTGIDDVQTSAKIIGQRYFDINGKTIRKPENAQGIIIIQTLYDDGSMSTKKVVKMKQH